MLLPPQPRFNPPLALQCSSVCPVGAIIEHSEWRQVLDALENKTKVSFVPSKLRKSKAMNIGTTMSG